MKQKSIKTFNGTANESLPKEQDAKPPDMAEAEHTEALLETAGAEATAEEAPSALQIAQARSKYDYTPATTAAWEHLYGKTRHVRPEVLRDGHIVKVNPETAQAVLFSMGLVLFTEADIAKAHDMEAWMRASLKESEQWALSKVGDRQFQQRDEIEANLAAGLSTEGMSIESRETINRTFIAHLNAGENARKRKTATEIVPFCKPILEKFWSALEEHMKTLEEHDRLECKAYSLPYHASILWQACFSVASAYDPARHLPGAGTWKLPSAILAGLVDF